jgi:hypothetical protein
MTLGKQLHQSAAHRDGFDPNCPRCLKDEGISGIIDHLTSCAVENEIDARRTSGENINNRVAAAVIAAEQRRVIAILKNYRMHCK